MFGFVKIILSLGAMTQQYSLYEPKQIKHASSNSAFMTLEIRATELTSFGGRIIIYRG